MAQLRQPFCNLPPDVSSNSISGMSSVHHRMAQLHQPFCNLPSDIPSNSISGMSVVHHRMTQFHQPFCNPPSDVPSNPVSGTSGIRHRMTQLHHRFCNPPPLMYHPTPSVVCQAYVTVWSNSVSHFVISPSDVPSNSISGTSVVLQHITQVYYFLHQCNTQLAWKFYTYIR